MNAALGFDTYVVMRHGQRFGAPPTPPTPPVEAEESKAEQPKDGGENADPQEAGGRTILGCYFCSSVEGPSNSMKDRTLDQQCTVTSVSPTSVPMSFGVQAGGRGVDN